MDKTTMPVLIKVYDFDGDVRQEIEGSMAAEELHELLGEIIKNDGIPVVRDLKLANQPKGCKCHQEAGEKLMEAIRKVMPMIQPAEGKQHPPMVLEYKTPEVSFAADGEAEAVMESSMDVLEAVYGDEPGYYIVKGEGVPKPLHG